MSILSTIINIAQKAPEKNMSEAKRQYRNYNLDYNSVCFQIECLQNEPDSPDKEEKLNFLLRKKAYLEERIQNYGSYGV